ncbi:MAG TPA: hypothetical protein VKP04_05320, partial [Ktedonobacteraceae bacterium]|nr:hypothetical protein [Ktedonobacteraceae bacterium]
MQMNEILQLSVGADTSAPGAIKRPPVVTLSRSEGSVSRGKEMLRCAQHDRSVTSTGVRIHWFMSIIAQYHTVANSSNLGNSGVGTASVIPAGTSVVLQLPALTSPW